MCIVSRLFFCLLTDPLSLLLSLSSLCFAMACSSSPSCCTQPTLKAPSPPLRDALALTVCPLEPSPLFMRCTIYKSKPHHRTGLRVSARNGAVFKPWIYFLALAYWAILVFYLTNLNFFSVLLFHEHVFYGIHDDFLLNCRHYYKTSYIILTLPYRSQQELHVISSTKHDMYVPWELFVLRVIQMAIIKFPTKH